VVAQKVLSSHSHAITSMSGLQLDQSIPICSVLAAFGGILEVFATAVLAWPAARIAQGIEWTDAELKGCLAINIIFQVLASLAGNLFATWFGPVAIVGPIFFAAQLLANLVVFWKVLGLEAFSREMQIGTYVVVVAVILLIVNGPGTQDYGDKSFEDLITQFYALIWAIILFGAMMVTGFILFVVDLEEKNLFYKMGVLLVARATGFALNLSTGKALVLPTSTTWLAINIAVKIISGIIYTHAIVVQSTAVQQKIFVPVNAATIIVVNAITGIIIWEDWRVVNSWVGYVCVFFLLALGCGLLLSDLRPLHEASPKAFLGARVSLVRYTSRRELVNNIRAFGESDKTGIGALRNKLETIQDEEDLHLEDGCDSEEAKRRNTVGGELYLDSVRQDAIRLSASVHTENGQLLRRRTNRLQKTERQNAWLSIYEGAGAAPQTTMRMSVRRLSVSDGFRRAILEAEIATNGHASDDPSSPEVTQESAATQIPKNSNSIISCYSIDENESCSFQDQGSAIFSAAEGFSAEKGKQEIEFDPSSNVKNEDVADTTQADTTGSDNDKSPMRKV